MSEMVERVAQAVEDAFDQAENTSNPGYIGGRGAKGFMVVDAEIDPIVLARAAIEAMRVPTETMLEAFRSYAQPIGYVEEGFSAMIDAALSTPKQKALKA